MQQATQKPSSAGKWVTLLLAAVILLPSLWGFGSKLREFIWLLSHDVDGAFTLMPVTNYLLASIGFFLLFAWAVMGGMFTNVEQPKYTMLEREQRLNEQFRRKRAGEAHNGESA